LTVTVKFSLTIELSCAAIGGILSRSMTTEMHPDQAEATGPPVRSSSPRERRKTRTMRLIQGEALRLFAEKGYDQTTIEEIADAADISPRTFFRYFPTKEDVVLWDEYDAQTLEMLDQRPAGEAPSETMRTVTRRSIEGLYRHDPERLLARHRLLFGVPAIRARFLEFSRSGVRLFAERFAAKRGLHHDDLKLQLAAIAIIDATGVAFDRWQQSGGRDDLLALFDQATDALIDGVAELRRSG
jgi:AcrR family transcriptional regulator